MGMENTQPPREDALAWIKTQLGRDNTLDLTNLKDREETAHKKTLLDQLHKQQEEIHRQIADLTREEPTGSGWDPLKSIGAGAMGGRTEQELLLEQIRTTLAPKGMEKDPNKILLKALITAQNKTSGQGGTNTLKPDILNRLGGEGEFSMAEWLASLNQQDEGESEISKLLSKLDDDSDCRAECRHVNMKSGMLDKATTNI